MEVVEPSDLSAYRHNIYVVYTGAEYLVFEYKQTTNLASVVGHYSRYKLCGFLSSWVVAVYFEA